MGIRILGGEVVAGAACACALASLTLVTSAAQSPQQFGGAYASLEPRRQALVDNWVARFTAVTGQDANPAAFYDEILPVSTKTTFDAVSHALITTALTDAGGAPLGDALGLIEYVETVRGEVLGASGDRQFRMYVHLTQTARETLEKSREFARGMDNTVYHKGYPLNYRQQGGVPSIQISIATDSRRADVDVDYRSSSFPRSMFNGHLSSANSDVRAGNNADRHAGRWAGLQNWWRSFFGIRMERAPDPTSTTTAVTLTAAPRAGRKNIDVMVHDFLTAWLVEGNVIAALGYIAPRAMACVALESDDPTSADLGMAPFQLMANMKAAHEALGPHASLEDLIVGTRLPLRELRVVTQPHHARFVITAVPDHIAAAFDCESRLALTDTRRVPRTYGNYYGATFYINGRRSVPVSLLWGKDRGYWRIVSWQTGADALESPTPAATPAVEVIRLPFDPALHKAVRGFYESWLVKKDYDAAFASLSPRSYACYDLMRGPDEPASTSPEDAGRHLRIALERAADTVRSRQSLEALVEAPQPVHPSVRVMDHRDRATFSLTSVPNALADLIECDVRAKGVTIPDPMPLEYGQAFGSSIRFRTGTGDAPVLRTQWRKEGGAWKLTAYGVEMP